MPLPYNHEELRSLEDKADKLLKDMRESFNAYNDHEDRSSAEAQEAKAKYEAISSDYDALEEKVKRVRDDVRQAQRIEDAQARHREFSADLRAGRLSAEDVQDDPDAPTSIVGSADLAEDEAYKNSFFEYVQCLGKRERMSPEAREMLDRGDANQVEKRGLATTVSSGDGGGSLIPRDLERTLIEYMKFYGPMVPGGGLCFDWNTETGNTRDIPYVDDTANNGNAGLTEAKRLASADSANANTVGEADPSIKQHSSTVTTFDSKMVKVTRELLQDSEVGSLENILGNLLGKRLGRIMNSTFTTTLISAIPSANVVTSASGSVATFSAENAMELIHEIDPSYRGVGVTGSASGSNLTYMFSDDVFKLIRLLQLPYAGTKAEGYTTVQYAFTVSNNLANGEPDRFLGKPFALNNAMPTLAKSKVGVILGDFDNMWVRRASPVFMEIARELFVERLLVGLMSWQRAGALCVNPNSFAAIQTAAS